jgi:hypothetical protein
MGSGWMITYRQVLIECTVTFGGEEITAEFLF